ncbi:MAG: hypothetical protein V4805_20915 [Pseudomonadota bacterium]
MTAKLRFILVAAGILIVLLSLLAILQIHRFKQLLIEVESSRINVVGLALKNDVERSLGLGLQLRDNGQLLPMLERTLKQYPGLISIHVVDLDLESGKTLWEVGPGLSSTQTIVARQRRAPTAVWFDDSDLRGYVLGWPVTDPIGRLVANLSIRFDKEKPLALIVQASHYVYGVLAALSLLLLVVLTPLLLRSLSRLDHVISSAKSILMGQSATQPGESDIAHMASELVQAATELEKARGNV